VSPAGPIAPTIWTPVQGRRRPGAHDCCAALRLREKSVERRAPGREQSEVESDVEDEDRARERIGLREREEVDRGEDHELEQDGRHEPPRERIAKALARPVEAEERERDPLRRDEEHEIGEREPHLLEGQQRLRARNRDPRPQSEREVEREGANRHVAGDGHRAEGRVAAGVQVRRETGFQAGRR
jgi:hypothetical protein